MCAILYFFLIVCNKPHSNPSIIYENIKEIHILAVGGTLEFSILSHVLLCRGEVTFPYCQCLARTLMNIGDKLLVGFLFLKSPLELWPYIRGKHNYINYVWALCFTNTISSFPLSTHKRLITKLNEDCDQLMEP